MNSTEQQQSSDFRAVEMGDTFDEQTGTYLGQLEMDASNSFPVELAICIDGYYYIYKLDRKERIEE